MSGCFIYRAGALFGARYVLDEVGEGIRRHSHSTKDRQHTVIALRGAVRVNSKRLAAGEMLTIADDREHEVVALEPNTEILNLNLYGVPVGLEGLVDGERFGDVDRVE